MPSKPCNKCGKDYPVDHYYHITNKKTGNVYVYNYCRKCHYEKTKGPAKKWRKNNPERWLQDVKKAQQAMFNRDNEGVYLLITTKGLYVGASDKIHHRVLQHTNSKFRGNVGAKGAKVLYHKILEYESDRDKRLKLEKYWIQKLQPELNVLHKEKYEPYFKKSYRGLKK
jgi:predicted GIY-YIG superfamily endonuclease